MKHCDREDYLLGYRLKTFHNLFDCLNKGGIFYLTIYNYCNNTTIELLYLLTTMFEYIVIYNTTYVYCYNFLGYSTVIDKDQIIDLLNHPFCIEPKININGLITYLETNIKYKNKLLSLVLNEEMDEYYRLTINEYMTDIKEQINRNVITNKNALIDFQKYLLTAIKSSFINKKLIKISSGIKQVEGNFLVETIKHNGFKNVLEVGFAFGISAFYILSTHTTQLISIDPFQSTQWNSCGTKLLKQFGLNKNHKLIQQKSFETLPLLLKRYGPECFDMIFIDGWHTFDYTLLDFFYANLLLREGGIIVIDDALHNGVKKCIEYIKTNYLFYKKINSPITVGAFKKMKNDDRDWNFHKNF